MRSLCLVSFALAAMAATGCSYQGVPGHGGGKRFYYEQEALASATRKAVGGGSITWDKLKGMKVNVFVNSVGDEGGGVAADGGLNIGALFGGGAAESVGDGAVAGGGVTSYSTKDFYGAYAFANAKDVDYLKAVVMEEIFKAGAVVSRDDSDLAGTVYVVVDTFGTNRWKRDFIIYSEVHLSAMVRLSAFFVDRNGNFTSLGGDVSRYRYMANYVLGKIGPLNPGAEIAAESPPGPLR